MFRLYFNSILVFALLLFISSCNLTTGDGPVVEKGFAKDPFHGVSVDGSFDVQIKQGTVQNVIVMGNENIIEKLKMDVMDGVLYLSLEPGNYLNYDLEIRLTVPTIDKVMLSGPGDIVLGTFVGLDDLTVGLDGSGDIKSDGVLEVRSLATFELDGSGDIDLKMKAKEVHADLQGSGDIDLGGSTSKLIVSLDGSGDIKAFGLESLHCQVTLEGSGTVKVTASQTLVAKLEGSGDIRYRGKPKVEASIDGSGSIELD